MGVVGVCGCGGCGVDECGGSVWMSVVGVCGCGGSVWVWWECVGGVGVCG